MKKYKLLYFVSEDHYFLTHKLPHALLALKNNFHVLVVCNDNNFKKKILSYGFEVVNLSLNRKSLNPLREIKTIIQLLNIINSFKPDLIQTVALKPILYGSLCSFLFDKSIKLNVSSIVGLGYLFINKGFINNIVKNIIEFFLRIFFKKKNSLVVFQNKDDQNLFINKKIVKIEQTRIIAGSGVNIKFFKPAPEVKKKFDLIMHSRMLVDKGVFDLIDSLKILRTKNLKLKVLLLGNPDKKNRASIHEDELKVWDKENIIKWIPFTENVLPYIQQSKIGILPSFREGFPKSLLESASCGLPLITTNVTGCREICIDKFNGFLVKLNDPIQIADRIEKLLSNKELQKNMGINSRKLVVNNFSDEIISKHFLKIYQSIS